MPYRVGKENRLSDGKRQKKKKKKGKQNKRRCINKEKERL